MAVCILIRNGVDNNPHEMSSKKGNIVEIRNAQDYINGFGNAEKQKYVFVEITDVNSKMELIEYTKAYYTKLDYSVFNNDLDLDQWIIDIFSTNVNSIGKGKLNYENILKWFDDANIVLVGHNNNGARVRFKIKNVVGSEWFWYNKKTDNVTLNELDYNKNTGVHIGEVRCPYSIKAVNVISSILENRGCTDQINDLENGQLIVTFNITRNQVFTELKKHLTKFFRFPIYKQRFNISESDVDLLQTYWNNNQVPYSITKDNFLNKIIDKELL